MWFWPSGLCRFRNALAIPHLTCPGARGGRAPAKPPAPHFYRQALASPALPNPSLLSTGPGPARPSPTPHFYRRALGRPGPPQPLTFIDRAQASLAWANPSLLLANPSLLLAGPDPSFLLAGLGQVRARGGGGGARSGRAVRAGGARSADQPLFDLGPPARPGAPPPPRPASLGGDVSIMWVKDWLLNIGHGP